jgi:serine/threonine protein kinase
MSSAKHAPANALEAGVQIGDFRIERRIGAGGMGIVYAARQLSLNRVVALKVLGQALTRGLDVSRFHREAQAAAMLKHPAIAPVYFIGQDEHLCYLAMELIEGISLRQAIDRLTSSRVADSEIDKMSSDVFDGEAAAKVVRFDVATGDFALDTPKNWQASDVNPYAAPEGPMRLSAAARAIRNKPAHVRRCCEIACDAAKALAYAHSKGVVHRDIKPDNLLLSQQRQVHLIDFGVARFFDDQTLTHTGQIVGTPIYMSPEQITGQKAIDGRTDVYSLGLVLYELLTLRTPVESTSRENVFRSINTKALPPVSWVNPSVSLELEAVVHHAAAKDPDNRYASAQELADDLQRVLDGKSVLAPPYRFRLDEGEIIAARPSGVIVSAFIMILGAAFVSLIMLCTTLMTLVILLADPKSSSSPAAMVVVATQGVLAIVIMAVGIVVTRNVLSGQSWARWFAVAVAIMQIVVCAVAVVGLMVAFVASWTVGPAPSPGAPPSASAQSLRPFLLGIGAMYSIPAIVGVVLGGVVVFSLLTRKTASWFRLASRIRGEHRNLQTILQNE